MSRNRYEAWIEANPLRKWRKEQKLAIMAVAGMLSVGFSTVQTWETGAHWPKPDSFEKIGRLLEDDNIEETWKAWLDKKPEWVVNKKDR